jgi:hypothetical protein
LIAVAALAAGCSSGTSDESTPEPPPWLDATYSDGTVQFDYPERWKVSSSKTFGGLVLDNVSAHPAFVSVRYLEPGAGGDPVRLAAQTIRPPEGRGLTRLYTQTAYLCGRRGHEVAFVWSTREDTPVGPTMRTFLIPLDDGRTAMVVLAAERPRLHGGVFRWVRETLRWEAPVRAGGRFPGGRVPADY